MRESLKNTDENALRFALWLCAEGAVDPKTAFSACVYRTTKKPRLGVLAVANGLLTVEQSIEILSLQSKTGRLYGESAVELGFLTEAGLTSLLLIQSASAPTLIEALCRISDIDRQYLLSEQVRYLNTEMDCASERESQPCLAR